MTLTCTHGFPSPASCVDCMEDGPVGPARLAPEQVLTAERWMDARYEGRCARRPGHVIELGDRIGYVEGVGWVCEGCAR